MPATRRAPWTGYLLVRRSDNALIGRGGFVAPPDGTGIVEIDYEIVPAHRNRGYATEAARLLVALAFDHGAAAVIARAPGNWNASNAVLQKLDMRFVEEQDDPALGPVWQWRVDRHRWQMAISA
jgi:RimJ/RimL family protein N-acetyltransferase